MATFTVNTHHAYLNHDIVIKTDGQITIEDTVTGQIYEVENELSTHLSAGRHILKSDGHEEMIIIEDAIKLGGGKIKKDRTEHPVVFVDDTNPWVFIVTYDRLYAANIESKEEKVEYNVTPDKIQTLGNNSEYFLFQKEKDYSVYNVKSGTHVLFFSDYICSSSHLVIFKKDKTSVVIYDFIKKVVVDEFEGQYSVGHYLYYIKDEKLFGINLWSSYNTIEEITEVGRLNDNSLLAKDYLLKNNYSSRYYLYSLRWRKQIVNVELSMPYYIDSLLGIKTKQYSHIIDSFVNFKEKERELLSKYYDLDINCIGINITNINEEWNNREIEICGNVSFFPFRMRQKVPFVLKGGCKDILDFSDAIFGTLNNEDNDRHVEEKDDIELAPGEKLLGKSQYGTWILKQANDKILLCNGHSNEIITLFDGLFDVTSYSSAYFTSDGKSVVLQISETEGQLLGITDLDSTYFEVEGFTVARNEGFNGYKPEIRLLDFRRPIWRDPITLKFVEEDVLSGHIFMSPDRRLSADTSFRRYYYNRLIEREISSKEYQQLCILYNWNLGTNENDKATKLKKRKELLTQFPKEKIVEHPVEHYTNNHINMRNHLTKQYLDDSTLSKFLYNEQDFTSLFIDFNDYVIYTNNQTNEENKIFIGRNVWFLNYVSFSYDGHYLALGAKMNSDVWRKSEEGVFVLYDIQQNEIISRQDGDNLQAVWMAMFSKKGDVAFYDSRANAFLMRPNYEEVIEAKGKSLLCFSPSGKYVACSDQNYIDYSHHPNENWGHQPSGNVFIHTVDDFQNCIEQYNDFGEGIEGVSHRAGSVASAAFAQDDKRLLVVGCDGVVVIRNLKNTFNNYSDTSFQI